MVKKYRNVLMNFLKYRNEHINNSNIQKLNYKFFLLKDFWKERKRRERRRRVFFYFGFEF